MIEEPKKHYLDTALVRPEDPRTPSFYQTIQTIAWYDLNEVVRELHSLLKDFHALTLYSYMDYDDQDGYEGSATYRFWISEPDKPIDKLDIFYSCMKGETFRDQYLRNPTDENLERLSALVSKIDSNFENWLRDVGCDHITLAWDRQEAKAHFVDTPDDY